MLKKSTGAWIFISHSNEDWDEVRKVRNLLEEKGHKPLLFFLKCLSDNDELDDLLKREIIARSWFLLCDSENAQKSKWVQKEVEFVKNLLNKNYEIINLEKSLDSNIEPIDRLLKRATVYLSYSRRDHSKAKVIINALLEQDYNVWKDEDISPGENLGDQIVKVIDNAVKRGFVLTLMSRESMNSEWVNMETQYALKKASQSKYKSNIIPIALDPIEELSLPLEQRSLQVQDFSKGDLVDNIRELIKEMKTCVMF